MKSRTLLLVALLMTSVVMTAFGGAQKEAVSSTQAKPITQLYLGGGRVGDTVYIFSQALASFINKKSEWLRVEVVATAGATANVELVIADPTKYFALAPLSAYGYFPTDPAYKYDKLRLIANGTSNTITFVTYDRNIKTLKDCTGKTVNAYRSGAGLADYLLRMIELSGAQNVRFVGSGTGEAVTNLKDGLVDVGITKLSRIYPATWGKTPMILDMETRKPVYYVSIPPEISNKLIEEEGSVEMPCRVPPGAMGGTQPEEFWAIASPLLFAADVRMDEEIVYEITKIIFETPSTEWAAWHPEGAGMTEEFIPVYWKGLDSLHPGASRYYKEHNVKIRDLRDIVR